MVTRWIIIFVLIALLFFTGSCLPKAQESLYFLSYSRSENSGELLQFGDGKIKKLYQDQGLVDFALCDKDFFLLTRNPTKSVLYLLKEGSTKQVKESPQTMIFLKPSSPKVPLALREIGKERETLYLLSQKGIESVFPLPKGALPLSISSMKKLALRVWENSGKKRLAKIYLIDLESQNPVLFRPALKEGFSEEFLSWSPDGNEFLFQRKDSKEKYSLFIYDLKNNKESLFRENAFSFQGALTGGESWSQDGHIIYSQDLQKEVFSQIFLHRDEQEWQAELKGASPYLSPDGKVLAFATPSQRLRPGENAPPQADLGIYSLETGKSNVLKIEGDFLSPISACWSNSSKFFAFVAYLWNGDQRPAGFQLYLYKREENSCQLIYYQSAKEILALAWESQDDY